MAQSAGLGPLYAWPAPVKGSPAARAYAALGFRPFGRVVVWEAPARIAHQRLGEIMNRARGRWRGNLVWRAVSCPLAEVDPAQVLSVYESRLARLGGLRPATVKRLGGEGADAFHPSISRVLRLENRVIGFVLAELDGDVCRVPARVIEPGFRAGLANLLLLWSALEADPPPPRRILQFETHDDHHQTVGLARRLGASPVQVREKMRLS